MNKKIENENHPELDGPLESAVWAVLSEPVPGNAIERVKQRAHEISAEIPSVTTTKKSPSRFPMVLRMCLAASVVATVVGGVTFLGIPFGSSNVYAQVAQRLENLRSMVCNVQFSGTGTLDESHDHAGSQKLTYLAPSMLRLENKQHGTVQIVNRQQNRTIMLMPATKQAVVGDGPAVAVMDATSPANLVEALMRHIRVDRVGDDNIQSLGTRTFDGAELQGYESKIGGETVRAWFDSKTFLPVMVAMRFEIPANLTNGNAVAMWQVMSDIKVDVDVSRDLFATDIPDGYETLSVSADAPQDHTPPALIDVIEMLRRCAGVNDSAFPISLSINDDAGSPLAIQGKFADALEQQTSEGDDAEKAAALDKVLKFGAVVGRAMAFQFSIKPENDWNYFGGAKLNQVDRPILWYSPAADENYKVVYADLTVKDVTRDSLPTKPEAVVGEATPRNSIRNSIRVSTPRFTLPKRAVREYAVLQQIRKNGKQAEVEYLSFALMREFLESQVEPRADGEIVMQEADPKWKPNRSSDSSRLAFLQEFKNLKGLDLSYLYLTQGDLDVIAGCTKLQRLSLSGVQVFDTSSRRLQGADLEKLSSLESLEQLDLSQSKFVGGLKYLQDIPQLHTLYLSSFEHLNDSSVAELSVLRNLRTLVLAPVYSTNPKTTVTDAGLQSLTNLEQLKTLYVGHHGKWTLPIDRLREILPNVDVRSPTDETPAQP